MKQMRMAIVLEDDMVLVEGKKIKLEKTESGIYILPLEKDEKKCVKRGKNKTGRQIKPKREREELEISTPKFFKRKERSSIAWERRDRNTTREEGYAKEENGVKKCYKEEVRCLNVREKFKEEERYDVHYEGKEEGNTESKDLESNASQYKEEDGYLTLDEDFNENSFINQYGEKAWYSVCEGKHEAEGYNMKHEKEENWHSDFDEEYDEEHYNEEEYNTNPGMMRPRWRLMKTKLGVGIRLKIMKILRRNTTEQILMWSLLRRTLRKKVTK